MTEVEELTKIAEPQQVAWRLFLTFHAYAYREIDAQLQEAGTLSFDDYDVLLTLNEARNETLRMSELAEAVLLSNSGMSRRVTTLVKSNLVTRTQSTNDGRVFWVKLTPKGRKALFTTWQTYKAQIEKVFSTHLNDEEAETMAHLLQKVLTGSRLPKHQGLLEGGLTDEPKQTS